MDISIFLGFTIIEEPSFQNKIDTLKDKYPRIYNDVHETLTWALGKNPDIGEPVIGELDHRIVKTTAVGETPSFGVLFRVDKSEGRVYLVSLTPDRELEEES
jgi:hypothetical protein